MLAVLIVLSGTLLAGVLSNAQRNRDRITEEALATAKQALIAYAVAHGETRRSTDGLNRQYVPGYLPCPDQVGSGTEGNSDTSTNSCRTNPRSQIGRFPWRELGLPPLKDGNGDCLWYAVSGPFPTYQNSAAAGAMINGDTVALFHVYDRVSGRYIAGPGGAERAAAVIFSAGPPISGQSRSVDAAAKECGGNYIASDYLDQLEGVNNAVVQSAANTLTTFISAPSQANFNDRLVVVSTKDIFDPIARSQSFQTKIRAMLHRAAECVAGFGKYYQKYFADSKRLPWAAAVSSAASSGYPDEDGSLSGRLPGDVSKSCIDVRGGGTCPTLERKLLSDANPFCTQWIDQTDVPLYYHWKDHFFYAIAGSHRPDSATTTPSPCPTCLRVNGGGSYAAVLMFSGDALWPKSRPFSTEKSDITNYLEGRNASNHPNASGNGDYESAIRSKAFNDVLICIDYDLNIIDPCPPN